MYSILIPVSSFSTLSLSAVSVCVSASTNQYSTQGYNNVNKVILNVTKMFPKSQDKMWSSETEQMAVSSILQL